jgi:tRNA(Ile)-lysidine synthase
MPEALARTARMLREDTEALDEWAGREYVACQHPEGGLDARRLAELPTAVRRRVIRLAALRSGAPAGTLAAAHIEAVDALVTGWRGQGPLQLPGAIEVRRTNGRLAFGETAPTGRGDGARSQQLTGAASK